MNADLFSPPPSLLSTGANASPAEMQGFLNMNMVFRSKRVGKPIEVDPLDDLRQSEDSYLVPISDKALAEITSGNRKVEYRSVHMRNAQRLWLFNPKRQEISHVVIVDPPCPPDEPHLGADSIKPATQKKTGYPIQEIFRLEAPISLNHLTREYGMDQASLNQYPLLPLLFTIANPTRKMAKVWPLPQPQADSNFISSGLSVLSWNVNSFRAFIKKMHVLASEGDPEDHLDHFVKYLERRNHSVICLQETMLSGSDKLRARLDSLSGWRVASNEADTSGKFKGRNGVMTLVRNDMPDFDIIEGLNPSLRYK
ncbi:hypothetical protein HDU96_004035, partial [Phlyctochytrium bullatum]